MCENKTIIIFSGYNDRAVVSFIRTLEQNGICYAVIARNDEDPVLKTSYKNNVVIVRENQCLNLGLMSNYIELIHDRYKVAKYFIAPSTEALNRFMQMERAALESMNVIVPLADADVYLSVSDKEVFGKICREAGIMVPTEYGSIAQAIFPFVAKPRKYYAENGAIYTPFLIFDKKQKQLFLEGCNPGDFYYQEYVTGRSIYLLYYIHRNGQVFKASQENLIQQPEGKSILAAVSSDFHNTAVSSKFEQLFTNLGFYGLVMVELKVNQNKNIMIEANPRFWGPSQLFIDAGVNLFESLLHDYGFITNAPIFRDRGESKYFWFGGVQNTFRENKEMFFIQGSENEFLMNLETWIQHDIYKRIDTIEVFKAEII